MERICPNCKIKLGSYDRFFCTACGTALPEGLVNKQNPYRRIANFAVTDDKKSRSGIDVTSAFSEITKYASPKLLIIAFGGLALFGVGFLTVNKYLWNFMPKQTQSVLQPSGLTAKFTTNTVQSGLNWQSISFKSAKGLDLVPFDARFVLMGSEIIKFGTEYVLFDLAYKPLLDTLGTQVEPYFILFASTVGQDYQWGLILFPIEKEVNLTQNMVEMYPWLKFWKNDPVFVMSPSDKILEGIADAKSGKAKNFTHSTVFSSSKNLLPETGKAVVYINDAKMKEFLKNFGASAKLSNEVKSVLESVLKSNSEFSLIL